MNFLIDTSLMIPIMKDRSGKITGLVAPVVDDQPVLVNVVIRMELLQGCRDLREWQSMINDLDALDYAELRSSTWEAAARIYYDLRRKGLTVRSSFDCLIAQSALDHNLVLLHNDRDFNAIAQIRPLKHHQFNLEDQ